MLEEQKLPGEREAVMSTRNVSTRSRCADSIAAVKRDKRIYMAKFPQLEYCGGTNAQKERIVELLNNYPKVVCKLRKSAWRNHSYNTSDRCGRCASYHASATTVVTPTPSKANEVKDHLEKMLQQDVVRIQYVALG